MSTRGSTRKNCSLCNERSCDGKIWSTFDDDIRQVDYVLAFSKNTHNVKHKQKCEMFCQNLENEGLELEHDYSNPMEQFIKIHVPRHVLISYCELLRFRMPIKDTYITDLEEELERKTSFGEQLKNFVTKPFRCVELNITLAQKSKTRVFHQFSREREYLFDLDDPNIFTPSVRISIAAFILERTRFTGILDVSNLSRNVVGIQKLLDDKVFSAAYPIHEGDKSDPRSKKALLLYEWASLKYWMRPQPLEEIKEYFGAQVALYFAWLGLYTRMLLVPSMLGLITVAYGLVTMFSNRISREICASNNTMIMCPTCDEQCDYWELKETCFYSRLGNLLDNSSTVIFGICISAWATVYLEIWKRYSSKLIHDWGLTNYSRRGEHPRPQYLSKLKNVKKTRINTETLMKEPHLSWWSSRFPRYFVSFSAIIFLICLSLCAIFSIVIFRTATIQAQNFYERKHSMTYKSLMIPTTTAIIDLFIISMLNYGYKYLAVVLTDLELKRTQSEYDESLSLKVYLFKFVNYYSSLFYIAFIKGKFVGYPGHYNRILGIRQEECNHSGCLMELCIELIVITTGRQVISLAMERIKPFLTTTYNRIAFKLQDTKKKFIIPVIRMSHTMWEENFPLLPLESQIIHGELLEKVIQFGFVTLFVVALPIGPLCALINNIYEIRSDAKKYLNNYRRPIPQRVKSLGQWTGVLENIIKLSVLTNAAIIAFTSTFIPEFIYKLHQEETNYLNFTHSLFNIQDFEEDTQPVVTSFTNLTHCYYEGFRNSPTTRNRYSTTIVFWQILAARVIFIVLYQNLVGLLRIILRKLIPDVSRDVKEKMIASENLVNRILLNQGHTNFEMIELNQSSNC